MPGNDPINFLQEKANRASVRHAKVKALIAAFVGIFVVAVSIYYFENLPEQNFVAAKIDDRTGTIQIRGDYTEFWHVTENEAPERDLFQGWPPRFIVPASLDRCGDRFAILVHEPHGDPGQERQLFYLLWYLQRDHPNQFSNLVVLQEGSIADFPTSRSLITDPSRSAIIGNRYFAFREPEIKASFMWVEDRAFRANEAGYGRGISEIVSTVADFGSRPASALWEEEAARSFVFDSAKNPDGSIDTQSSLLEVVEYSDLDDKAVIVEKLGDVTPEHANLARFLLGEANLRAAFAYEIFAEGFTREGEYTVDVFGIEDPLLYGASCRLFPQCNGEGERSPQWKESSEYSDWNKIQPYRQAVMANNILRVLDEQVPVDTIPVISAAIHGHLPELRGYLCEAGYDTVGLTPTKNVTGDLLGIEKQKMRLLNGYGTTPLYRTTIRNSIIDLLREGPGSLPSQPW